MTRVRTSSVLAAALALLARAPARANPSLSEDFANMSKWLSHELAQGLAFNAGSTFDPPKEVTGSLLQPDVSLGIGRIPFDKRSFPTITTPALNDFGGQNLFPNHTLFPNLALHLRMGLPWREDLYLRFANATTPASYRISRTMTAQVQSNSYGAGLRQHLFGGGERATLTLGAHYNHVRGRTRLKGKFLVDTNGFSTDSDFSGAIDWNVNSFGLTAVAHQTFDAWTPFAGIGYNYATGSARTRLEMRCQTFLCADILGEASEHPEQSQGRWIFGVQYARPSWSLFANGEMKAIGHSRYRTYIIQAGAALPFEIGRWPRLIWKKGGGASGRRSALEDDPEPRRARPEPRRPKALPPEKAPPDMIFLQ